MGGPYVFDDDGDVQHSLTVSPLLPNEIIWYILELLFINHEPSRPVLSLISRVVRGCSDRYLYANIKLNNARAAGHFLRTLRNPSKFKTALFFDRAVQTLDISSDIEPECVLEILNSCRSATSLTYWGPPTSHPFAHLKTPARLGVLTMGKHGHLRWSHAVPEQWQCLLLPERLSISLREDLPVPFNPYLSGPYFLSVTHLSLGNRWEHWSTWLASMEGSLLLSLQHLKLEISGGIRGPEEHRYVTSTHRGIDKTVRVVRSEADRIAKAVDNVLQGCLSLKVLILQMRCDATPTKTAGLIARALSQFQPRVVFAWEKQPFRYPAAHDQQEARLWKSAEVLVRGQGKMCRHVLLDCDALI